ncbi:hypothetical protein AB4Z48_21780 [Cupriavidus sp. 2TAF22]|uniref:hypothetical protein n=1 Tax=unclassified Cupriavidus TaxID=2640874 RepID=UPI003F936A53
MKIAWHELGAAKKNSAARARSHRRRDSEFSVRASSRLRATRSGNTFAVSRRDHRNPHE